MLTIEEAIEKFEKELPEEVQLLCGEAELMNPLTELEKNYGVALSPLVIYAAISEIDTKALPAYLENEFSMDSTTAQKLASELSEKIFRPLFERIEFINEHPEKTMTIEQEKNHAETMFREKILSQIARDPLLIDAVNRRLFFILGRDESFKHRLEQVLYENEETLTSKPILVGGEELRPTVGNWLKDFMSRFGSQSFDSVSLSAFLINSDNGKKLTNEERQKLARILKLYTNIKFFPQSMPSDDGTDWQIIPYELAIVAEPLVEKSSAPVTENSEMMELKNMLLQYPVGSLERAAIEEELKNFKS